MRAHTRTSMFAYAILLASIIAGGYVAATPQAVTVEARVYFLPWWIDLNKPSSCAIYAIIEVPKGYRLSDINPGSILLENTLAPVDTTSFWFFFSAKFDRDSLINIILYKIYHMGILLKWQIIYLKVTGEFKDGTPFEGMGEMMVMA